MPNSSFCRYACSKEHGARQHAARAAHTATSLSRRAGSRRASEALGTTETRPNRSFAEQKALPSPRRRNRPAGPEGARASQLPRGSRSPEAPRSRRLRQDPLPTAPRLLAHLENTARRWDGGVTQSSARGAGPTGFLL